MTSAPISPSMPPRRARPRRTRAAAALRSLVGALLPVGLLGLPATGAAQAPLTSQDLAGLRPRSIGPAVTGGRIHDVEAVPSDPSVLWVATASGGLWKSENRGHSWTNVFDTMAVSTAGDVALAPSDPAVVYFGTGEQNNRQSTSYGNGVYRSDDGGASWRHLGLEETRHIGKVEVHPEDPDVAWVAALGNLWAPSEERGVYRTTDGGATWEKVLYVDEYTGAVDLVVNPRDPDVLYAALYQRMRKAWGFNGGGPGSGIFRSTDGGDSWTELTAGLPEGDKGRIGLAIAASDPRILNALVETADRETTGTYRSEDGGDTWERVNPLNGRPMYYSHIFIDPTDPDVVYTLATDTHVSTDGGRTFREFAGQPTYDVGIHRDQHALWIDPSDPEHLYMGGDGGLLESYDGGTTFRKVNNFAVGQFYAIGVDMREPYHVFGGMQDNHSWMGPSETRSWAGILNDDWRQVGFSDGMFWDADPREGARWAYGSSQGGNYFRVDVVTGDMVDVNPPPTDEEGNEHRFDWTSPLLLSRHDPDVLYVAGNRLFVSRDQGESWSWTEELSRGQDRDGWEIMGVPQREVTISPREAPSTFGEATTLDESPLDPGVLWVGMDDGNLQVTRDGGESWTEVSGNVPGLPDGTYVSRVVASAGAPGRAWAAFDPHRDGEFSPYLYRTEDFGRTWTPLHGGLPGMGVVNAVAEHPDDPDVVFVGTEHHVFVSVDAGESWARIPGLPTTAYDDVVVHPRDRDLVLGTHGRSIWIVDDVGPLAEWDEVDGAAHLFAVAPAVLKIHRKDTSYRGHAEYAGENPPDGALVTYRLGPGDGPAHLHVARPDGTVLRTLRVPAEAGTHRINWDLRHPLPGAEDVWTLHQDPELPRPIGERGPFVAPGRYLLTLEARGTTSSTTVEVRGDPELPATQAQYESRELFLLDLLALREALEREMEARGVEAGRFGQDDVEPGSPEARLRTALGAVRGVYGDLNGGGVRGGTLLPPTATMRVQVASARRVLEELGR